MWLFCILLDCMLLVSFGCVLGEVIIVGVFSVGNSSLVFRFCMM